MSAEHIAGIVATVEAAGLTIYDTNVPTLPNFPYLLLSAPDFDRIALSLDDIPRDIDSYFQLTAVGSTVNECRRIQDSARVALDRKAPAVTGYVTHTKRTSPGKVYPDTSITLPQTDSNPFLAPDQWRYTATPTA